jgi:hypothetical protein
MERAEQRHPPGPLEDKKRGPTTNAGPEPQAAEVESARNLANQARDRLRASGLDDDTIGRLADQYVAEDRGESVDGFVEWARARARRTG